jgi:DNA transformation protein
MLHRRLRTGDRGMSTQEKLRNIGPKSAAWLRQVGLRTREDLADVGAVDAFMRVKRAGFKPSLNLLYALEGALCDCHWQDVSEARRTLLVSEAEGKIALLPAPRGRPAAGPVTTTMMERTDVDEPTEPLALFDPVDGAPSD